VAVSEEVVRLRFMQCGRSFWNNVRDLTASLLSEVCHNVKVEPNLQPLTGEELRYRTAVCDDDAGLDIHAAGFWGYSPAKCFF